MMIRQGQADNGLSATGSQHCKTNETAKLSGTLCVRSAARSTSLEGARPAKLVPRIVEHLASPAEGSNARPSLILNRFSNMHTKLTDKRCL